MWKHASCLTSEVEEEHRCDLLKKNCKIAAYCRQETPKNTKLEVVYYLWRSMHFVFRMGRMTLLKGTTLIDHEDQNLSGSHRIFIWVAYRAPEQQKTLPRGDARHSVSDSVGY